jgi:hypothetical protein
MGNNEQKKRQEIPDSSSPTSYQIVAHQDIAREEAAARQVLQKEPGENVSGPDASILPMCSQPAEVPSMKTADQTPSNTSGATLGDLATHQERGRVLDANLAGPEASVLPTSPPTLYDGGDQDASGFPATERGGAVGPQMLVYSHQRVNSRPEPTMAPPQDGQPTLMTSTFISRMSKTVVGGYAQPPQIPKRRPKALPLGVTPRWNRQIAGVAAEPTQHQLSGRSRRRP